MSKLWILLLAVTAFQAVHSYPAEFLEDESQSTVDILKEAWGKLKGKYEQLGKDALQQIVDKLNDKLCKEEDFDGLDFAEDDENTDSSDDTLKQLVQKLRELREKYKAAIGEEKEKLGLELQKLKAQFCDKLSKINLNEDFQEDESTLDILKDAFDKLKNKYEKLGKEKLQQIVDKLNEKLCNQEDFENMDLEEDDEGTDSSDDTLKQLVQKLRELREKYKAAIGEEKEKLEQQIQKLKGQFCDKLNKINLQDDYQEDESTLDILKDAFDKLKNKYEKLGKEKLQKIVNKLNEKLCKQEDFENDLEFEEDDEDSGTTSLKQIVQKLRELREKYKAAIGEERVKLEQEIQKLKGQFCDKLNNVNFQNDFQEDDDESTLGILKEAWDKLKVKYEKLGKEKLQQVVDKLNEKLCKQEDFENLDYAEEDAGSVVQGVLDKIKNRLKELREKYEAEGEKLDAERQKLEKEAKELKAKLCDELSKVNVQQEDVEDGDDDDDDDDDDDEEDRIKWGKLGKNIGKNIAKGLKKMKEPMKKAMKKGAKLLKDHAVKVTPLQCHEKSCKSCVTVILQSFCVDMTLMRTNKATYLIVGVSINDDSKGSQKIKLGDVPRCVDIGGTVGKICLKGLEGKGKSSKGQADVNFCLVVLAESHGVGCKFCASYKDKKMKVRFAPKLFPGGKSEDGDIVQLDKNEEDGIELDADEFELED